MSTWVKRHTHIMKYVKPDICLEYKTLAMHPEETIKHICKQFKLPWFKGKERYWETDNTQLFGNNRARNSTGIQYHPDEKYVHFNTEESTDMYTRMKTLAYTNTE